MAKPPAGADGRPRLYIRLLRDGSAFWRTSAAGVDRHAPDLAAAVNRSLDAIDNRSCVIIVEGR